MKIIKDKTSRCGVLGCNEETEVNIALDKMIKIGALGYQSISFPICKKHYEKAYNEEYLMKVLLEK